jgi:5-dehydro-2-deoxygluconokinase
MIPEGRTYDVLSMGRSCIDLYAHQIGVPITSVTSFDAYVGGCPTNVAVGASRLGLRTMLLTAVGEDQVGDFVLGFLRQEAIDTQFIPRKPDRRTSAAIVTIQPPDRFPLTLYRDNCADNALTIADVERAPVADSRLLFVTGTGLSRETSCTATTYAVERARAAGTFVVLDIDRRADQWPDRATLGVAVRRLLRDVDVAIGTEDEICSAADVDNPHAAARVLFDAGLRELIVKRGVEGATWLQAGRPRVDVPPFKVEILNVLGAGDAFAAGFLFGLLAGWSRERSIRMGNATGAILVTRHGCANFMPTLAEVDLFVAAHGGWEWAGQST